MTKSVQSRIDELKGEIAKLEEEQNKLNELSEAQQLAIQMHKSLCRSNHTDGCGWHYVSDYKADSWTSEWAHQEWLKHAEELIAFCEEQDISIDCAIQLIELAGGWH